MTPALLLQLTQADPSVVDLGSYPTTTMDSFMVEMKKQCNE